MSCFHMFHLLVLQITVLFEGGQSVGRRRAVKNALVYVLNHHHYVTCSVWSKARVCLVVHRSALTCGVLFYSSSCCSQTLSRRHDVNCCRVGGGGRWTLRDSIAASGHLPAPAAATTTTTTVATAGIASSCALTDYIPISLHMYTNIHVITYHGYYRITAKFHHTSIKIFVWILGADVTSTSAGRC